MGIHQQKTFTKRTSDHKTKRLVEFLEDQGDLDDTLVIITSDHGEGFGEPSPIRPSQYAVGHTVGAHESQVHVPLIVSSPDSYQGSRVSDLATLTNFPLVVKSAVAGNVHPEQEFITGDEIITTQLPLGKESLGTASSYGIDTDKLSGSIRVVYEQVSGEIYKHIQWKDNCKTIALDGRDIDFREDCRERINNSYTSYKNKNIKEKQEISIDEKTKQHLSELGYT
jgi:hypothetical protein